MTFESRCGVLVYKLSVRICGTQCQMREHNIGKMYFVYTRETKKKVDWERNSFN